MSNFADISRLQDIWAKIRWTQLQPWHLSWVPNELHGGISNREAVDSYFQVALDIEQAQFQHHPLYGALYDYQKCFDRIAWQIQTGILQDLGMPKKVSSAMFSYNQSILRRFKIGKSVAPTFSNTNSICQGCPLAIIRIYAMIAMWIQVIKTHPHTTLCKASAFIDDKNLRSTSFEAFCTAIDNTRSFDKAVDAQMFLPLTR